MAPLETTGEISYFIATGATESKFQSTDSSLAKWALEDWSRASNGRLRFTPAPEASALIRIYWVAANYGQFGEMQPTNVDGLRGAAVYIRPDTDAFGGQIAQRAEDDPLFRDVVVYLTCLHELGHALGLEHTENYADIMYSFEFGGDIPGFFSRYRDQLNSREDIASHSGLSRGDVKHLQTLYNNLFQLKPE